MTSADAARSRALLLLRQGRADLAEPELRRALADAPDDPDLHAYLALVLADLDRAAEALPEAERAVGLAPDWAFTHYARAVVLNRLDRPKDALAAAREALRLDPADPDAHTALAIAHLGLRQRQEALDAAEAALAVDPEHTGAANLRALALVQLGRRDEAAATVQGVLSRSPDDAVSHANQGWTLLHQNRHREAMESFREALRLDPGNDWARSGIVEAMKARNVVYRQLLRYFLWMERLSQGQRWAVLVGGYLLARFVPALLVVYLPLVLLTWAGDAFFNLVLFLPVRPAGALARRADRRRPRRDLRVRRAGARRGRARRGLVGSGRGRHGAARAGAARRRDVHPAAATAADGGALHGRPDAGRDWRGRRAGAGPRRRGGDARRGLRPRRRRVHLAGEPVHALTNGNAPLATIASGARSLGNVSATPPAWPSRWLRRRLRR